MEHSEFKDLVTLYLTGELDEEKSDQFEMHFFSCKDCRDYLLQNRSTLLLTEKFFTTANIDEVTGAFDTDNLFSDNKSVSVDKRQKVFSGLQKNINNPDILVKRIIAEIQGDNIKNALYLIDTVIFLFPDHKNAQRELTSALTELSNKLIKKGQLEQTETVISKALLLSPDDANLLSTLVKIKKKQRVAIKKTGQPSIKDFAYQFIKENFPEELHIFDIAWRVFKNIDPNDFDSVLTPEALGIIQIGEGDIKTPKVLIMLDNLSIEGEKVSTSEEIADILTEIGQKIGCPTELIHKIIQRVSKEYL